MQAWLGFEVPIMEVEDNIVFYFGSTLPCIALDGFMGQAI
jgi:hypothetical protein